MFTLHSRENQFKKKSKSLKKKHRYGKQCIVVDFSSSSSGMNYGQVHSKPKRSSPCTLGHYILIDSVIFVRGLWTTKQGLKGNWPSSWQVTDTLSWGSLILLLSLHEAYITNYNAYGVIYHLMDLLLLSPVFSPPSPSLPTRAGKISRI